MGLGYWHCISRGKARGRIERPGSWPKGLRWSALTFLAMFAKWAPQALQLGSEPVGEGKELYPGLE